MFFLLNSAVTCPKCSLYQAVPTNSNGFICPRCNNIITGSNFLFKNIYSFNNFLSDCHE